MKAMQSARQLASVPSFGSLQEVAQAMQTQRRRDIDRFIFRSLTGAAGDHVTPPPSRPYFI
jgi:hypothetical protein